jgi:hypothetical protein
MNNFLAQNFGTITPPATLPGANPGQVIGNIIERIIQVMIVGAGIYALINFVLAGYSFLSAGDDAKKVAGAWAKIWQTVLGLFIAAGSFVLAQIFSQLIFGQGFNILNPTLNNLP